SYREPEAAFYEERLPGDRSKTEAFRGLDGDRLRRIGSALVVHEDRRDFEMRVYCGKSAKKHCLTGGPFVLLIAITVFTAMDLPVRATLAQQQSAQQKTKQSKAASDRVDRDAKTALKQGKYDAALAIYLGVIETDPRDNRDRLGASFAYLKMQNYAPSFQQAKEVLSIDANNARAHALAGISLLRS